MSKAMLEKLIIKETKDLSAETLDEILDFIKFKKLRAFGKQSFENSIKSDLNDLGKVSLTHLEEEFSNYKERYPLES